MGNYYAHLFTILFGNIRYKESHHPETPVTCVPLGTTAPDLVPESLRSFGLNRFVPLRAELSCYLFTILYGNIRYSLLPLRAELLCLFTYFTIREYS